MRVAIVAVAVGWQSVQWDHPIDWNFNSSNNQTVGLNAPYDPCEQFSDPFFQEMKKFDSYQFPLGLLCILLGMTAMLAHLLEHLSVLSRLLTLDELIDNPMHDQVRVASDGTGEMAVMGHVQCIMPFKFALIDRFGHALENRIVDGKRRGLAFDAVDDPLNFKTVLHFVGGDPQGADELIQSTDLELIGWRVRPSQER